MPGVTTLSRSSRLQHPLFVALAVLAVSLFVTPAARAAEAVPGELIVKFADGTSRAQSHELVGDVDATIEQRLADDSALVQVDLGASVTETIHALDARNDVLYAEPNFTVQINATSTDDFLQDGTLWGILGINAPSAWDHTMGVGTVVAVLDSGIESHPELDTQLWQNPRDPINGVDDDGNGFIDDTTGADWVRGDGYPDDEEGHGTHVAGTIVAAANDGNPAVGVAPGARVMALKFLDGNGSGSVADAIGAVDYAITNGANVINASWGGPDYSRALEDSMARAGAAGIVVAAAAGNESANNDHTSSYPANFGLPNMISIGASNKRGKLADFSNFGQSVDLAAPGENILSTVAMSYEAWSGTSMATPHVSGVAALVHSAAPTATADQVVAAIINGSTASSLLSGKVKNGNLLNATGALSAIGVSGPATDSSSAPSRFKLRRPGRRVMASRDRRVRFSWSRSSDTDFKAYELYVDGRLKTTVSDPDGAGPLTAATASRVKLSAGRHRWTVVAVDMAGNHRKATAGKYRGRIAVISRH